MWDSGEQVACSALAGASQALGFCLWRDWPRPYTATAEGKGDPAPVGSDWEAME